MSSNGGIYEVKPDMNLASVFVTCKKEGNEYITELGHNREETTFVTCYEEPCSWSVVISYHTSDFQAAVKLVDQSKLCKQHTTSTSRETLTFGGNGELYSYVTDRYGNATYWGGGDDSNFCACHKTKSCYGDINNKCNCDDNSMRITTDEGCITNKEKLPLKSICVGDTGSSIEYRYVTIGKLICSDE